MPGLTALQTRAIVLMHEHAAAGQYPTYQQLAKALKCRAQNFSEWVHNPAWAQAVVACFRSTSEIEMAVGEAAVLARLRRGDSKLYLDLADRGAPVFWAPRGIDHHDGGGAGGFQNQGPRVEVHVHGIPPRDPISTLPPVRSLPAAPAPGGSK